MRPPIPFILIPDSLNRSLLQRSLRIQGKGGSTHNLCSAIAVTAALVGLGLTHNDGHWILNLDVGGCSSVRHVRDNPTGCKAKGSMKLTPSRIAALDELGFDWSRRKVVIALEESAVPMEMRPAISIQIMLMMIMMMMMMYQNQYCYHNPYT